MKKYISIIAIFFLVSCSNDDDTINNITVNYQKDLYITSFLKIGKTDTPQVNWYNNTGNFSLKEKLKGFSIDETTGQIFWDKTAHAGSNLLTVIAKNNNSTKEIPIEVYSDISQTLWTGGSVNNAGVVNFSKHIRLLKGGKVTIEYANNPDLNSDGVGIWSFEDNKLIIEYCTYCPDTESKDVPNMQEHALIEAEVINDKVLEIRIEGKLFTVDANRQNKQERYDIKYFWD